MKRIQHSAAVGSLPAVSESGTVGYFTKGDPGVPTPATVVTHEWLNRVQEELCSVIETAGLTLDGAVNNQLYTAILLLASGQNSRTQTILTDSATLTNAAHGGGMVLGNKATAHTATLMAANTMAVGRRVAFMNIGAGPFTIQRAGADTITVNNTTVTSIVLEVGDTLVLESNGAATFYAVGGNAQMKYAASNLASGTAVALSGTSTDITGIPSWAKRVTCIIDAASTNGADGYLVQIGDSGGVETTGYESGASTGTSASSSISGFIIGMNQGAVGKYNGHFVLTKTSGDKWIGSGGTINSGGAVSSQGSGNKTLSSTLDRVRLTTTGGTNTFDNGTFNAFWE